MGLALLDRQLRLREGGVTTPKNGSNGVGPLRRVIEQARLEYDLSMTELTVLSPQIDPYRLDTVSGHRAGAWFGEVVSRLLGDSETVHLRGLHYRLVAAADVIRPDKGFPYINDEDCWLYLVERAAKAGRWLGYVDFSRIVDERNAAPVIYVAEAERRYTNLSAGLPVAVPELVLPTVCCNIPARQKFRIVLFGEKVSLRTVLEPIARMVQGELLLPTGEATDTMIAEMAARASQDECETVVLYFADHDPSGHQMSISASRKLQALRDFQYPDLRLQLHAVALTLAQIREFNLPSTPLKETERRADHWRQATGHEQVEIDALAALQPDTLRAIAVEAITPFYDRTLQRRALEAEIQWNRQATAILEAHPAYQEACSRLESAHQVMSEAAAAFHTIQQEVERELSHAVELPLTAAPEPELDEPSRPLFTTADDYITATRRLVRHKGLEAI